MKYMLLMYASEAEAPKYTPEEYQAVDARVGCSWEGN